jgi:RNA recognition motif-containing protein
MTSSGSEVTPSSSSSSSSQQGDCRLWIGNLDLKVTEYAMLKLLQRYSVTIRSFDFIYHRAGPEKGRPRGYCFVTLATPSEAAFLMRALDGKLALSRRLAVKYAEVEKPDRLDAPIAPQSSSEETKKSDISIDVKIQAIEAKLKTMEENKDGSAPPVILYPPPANLKRQQELAANAADRSGRRNRSEFRYRRPAHRNRPYRAHRR